jgi:hypothetical protein
MSNEKLTRLLLTCGIIAGPFYVLTGVIQILLRPGFDVTKHALSLMSNGDLGWIQVSNFIITGLLAVAFAVGIRKTLAGTKGGVFGPLLIGIYGIGLIGAGIFPADPALGFPPGTPMGPSGISTTGFMHFVFGGVGFYAVIASCFVFAWRFWSTGERGWSWFSIATGVLFNAAFMGIAMGSGGTEFVRAVGTVSFYAAVLLLWSWMTMLAVKLRRELT